MNTIIEFLKSLDYSNVFTTVLLIVSSIVGISLIRFINSKKNTVDINNTINYKDSLLTTIQDITYVCVAAINQTFVNELKKAGKFDDEAKHAAFEKVYTTVYNIVADMIKPIIPNEIDQEAYITAIIEQTVAMLKDNDYCECEDYDASDITDEQSKALDEYLANSADMIKDVNMPTATVTFTADDKTDCTVHFDEDSEDKQRTDTITEFSSGEVKVFEGDK